MFVFCCWLACGLIANALLLTYPHRNISSGLKSGDLGECSAFTKLTGKTILLLTTLNPQGGRT